MQQKWLYFLAGVALGYLFLGSLLGGVSGFIGGGARKAE